MTDNVIPLGGVTRLDIPADRVLENNIGQLEGVVLIGFGQAGEVVTASSYADGGTVLWLLEKCRRRLMNASDELEVE